MALISCVVYDPPGEPRTELLRGCLQSLADTVDWDRHRLITINNGICAESKAILDPCNFYCNNVNMPWFTIIGEGQNIGTARAINKAWQLRNPGEHAVKVDSDILFHEPGWLDKLEECVGRDPRIGQVGLKRPDLAENPWVPAGDWNHSDLHMLPHQPGQTWLVVEKVRHCMGSAVLHSSALLDKVGYLYQMGSVYGFDDGDMSARSECAGFYNCFLPNYSISHPDPGGGAYQKSKERTAGQYMDKFLRLREDYKSGRQPLWRGPEDA